MTMHQTPKNSLSFEVWGRYALFTDPLTRLGGEKCSYHMPTYEAIKGVAESIYWKPTFTWIVDKVRILKPIRTEAKNMKPINLSGGNTLATYTYLADVHYEAIVHFEWNLQRPDLKADRDEGKHFNVAQRMLKKGGRRDIFLGTRECQGYVAPCNFGERESEYHQAGELAYGMMFHGFDYPDQTGQEELQARFWQAKISSGGILEFPRPDAPELIRRKIRKMTANPPETVGLEEKGLLP